MHIVVGVVHDGHVGAVDVLALHDKVKCACFFIPDSDVQRNSGVAKRIARIVHS